jgi:hypothetical protein
MDAMFTTTAVSHGRLMVGMPNELQRRSHRDPVSQESGVPAFAAGPSMQTTENHCGA